MTIDSIYMKKVILGKIPFLNTIGVVHRIARTGLFVCQKGYADIRLDGVVHHLTPHCLITYFAYSDLEILDKSADIEGVLIGGDLETVQPLLYKISDFNSLIMIRQNPLIELNEIQERNMKMYFELIEDGLARLHGAFNPETELLTQFKDIRLVQIELLTTSMMLDVVSFYNHFDPYRKEANRKDDVLMKFISSLYKNYRTEHEVTFYANQQFLTSRYFSAIIKDKSGKTPSQWIATALLVEAKNKLRQSSLSVKEISELLNFPNQSYFGKWFKNLTGISPLEYKNGRDEIKITEDEFSETIRKGSMILNGTNEDM